MAGGASTLVRSRSGESSAVSFDESRAPLRISLGITVLVLIFFALWNFSKMPFYWENQVYTNVTYNVTECSATPEEREQRCSGMVAQYNLFRAFGIESAYKIRSDKDLFLLPHTAMGVALEVQLIFGILHGREGLYARSKIFFPMSILFALHIIPAAKGIPDSIAGAPVNETLAALIIAACCVGFVGMRKEWVEKRADVEEMGLEPSEDERANGLIFWAWLAIGCLINLAPLGEWGLILAGGKGSGPDVPHPESGHDFYATLGCPWIGRVVAAFSLFTVFMYAFDDYAKLRGASWRSPFSNDGPALYQVATMPYPDVEAMFELVPERWLEATGECFVLCILVSWMTTAIFNPGIFTDNILRTLVGYNNLCVGFDSVPARYVAMPFLVLQAVLAARYTYLDTIRLKATRAALTDRQYYFAYWVNAIFSLWMMCFPLLLVVTAEFESWASTKIHLYLFMVTLIIMWAMIAGNVYEAPALLTGTKIWFGLFTFHTFALPVVGVIDILSFHPDLPADQIYTIRYEHPHPRVPWPITAYFDYGWFLLLLLTVVFLPDSPPVRTTMACDLAEVYGLANMVDDDKEFLREDSESEDEGEARCGL